MALVSVSTNIRVSGRRYTVEYQCRTRDAQTAAGTLRGIVATYEASLPYIDGSPEQLQMLADQLQATADDIQANVPGTYTQDEADAAQAEATAAQAAATAAADDIWD